MSSAYDPYADLVVRALIAEAEADPDVIGLILCGSLGAGLASPESDYDVAFVVTDEAFERYGDPERWPVRGAAAVTDKKKDIWHASPRTLAVGTIPEWEIPGYAEGRVIFDRAGQTAALHEVLRLKPEERAREETAGAYDAYLNALYRSLKAWRRGNDLGGRMQAAESATLLLGLLFALERRWRPYHDRLSANLHSLDAQGWAPGELRAILLDLITAGEPRRQQEIARRVAALLRDRGYQHIYDAWEGEIDRVLAWEFA